MSIIPDYISTNFDRLLRAASDGNLALMECTDAVTGEPRYVICAVGRESTNYVFTPFGHLVDGNPYERLCAANGNPAGTIPNLIPLRRTGSGRGGSHVNGQAVFASPSAMRDMRSLNRVFRPLPRNGIRRR